jgi:MHS family alpha-ketoglutarate permease-like MFS transporter
LARLIQGLSVGGEYGTTATYMSEVALKGQRGFFASFQYVTLIGGQLLAVLVVVILQQFLSEDELRAWGWRIPFVVGAVAALISLLLRRSLKKPPAPEMREDKDAGIAALFRDHKAAFITVLGYTAGGSLIFYTFTTYMQKYLVNTAGMHAKTASYMMTGALFLYMCMQPLFGMLADKIGRRNSMLLVRRAGYAVHRADPAGLKTVSSPFMAFVLITLALAIVSFYTSISGLVKAEMFPPQVRALGVGLAYAVANAVFGGSAEYVALGLKPWAWKTLLLVRDRHDGGGFPVQPAPAQAGGVPASRSIRGRYDTAHDQLFDAYFTADTPGRGVLRPGPPAGHAGFRSRVGPCRGSVG